MITQNEAYATWVAETNHCNYMRQNRPKSLDALLHAVLGLTEEAGEVAGVLKKVTWHTGLDAQRLNELMAANNGDRIYKLIEELGDVLYYVVTLCNILNIPLTHLSEYNTLKLCKRFGDPWPYKTLDMDEVHERLIKAVTAHRTNGLVKP